MDGYFGTVKGASVGGVVAQLKQELGEGGFAELLAKMPARAAELGKRRILAVEWIPLDEWLPFNEAIFSHVCKRDTDAYIRFVRRGCERDFNLFYRMLLRIGSPAFIVEKGAQVFNKYHQDAGTYEVVERFSKEGRDHIVSRVTGFPPWEPERYVIRAFLEQLVEMSGAKEVRVVERRCEVTDKLSLELETSWKH